MTNVRRFMSVTSRQCADLHDAWRPDRNSRAVDVRTRLPAPSSRSRVCRRTPRTRCLNGSVSNLAIGLEGEIVQQDLSGGAPILRAIVGAQRQVFKCELATVAARG